LYIPQRFKQLWLPAKGSDRSFAYRGDEVWI
jgi:hypothetical protein